MFSFAKHVSPFAGTRVPDNGGFWLAPGLVIRLGLRDALSRDLAMVGPARMVAVAGAVARPVDDMAPAPAAGDMAVEMLVGSAENGQHRQVGDRTRNPSGSR
jgi:hypothetical protein